MRLFPSSLATLRRTVALILASALMGCGTITVELGSVNFNDTDLGRSLNDLVNSIRVLTEGISQENEYFYGRQVSTRILDEFAMADPETLDTRKERELIYVNLVGGLLATVCDFPNQPDGWHFIILESPVPGAYSAPAGFVFITRGMLQTLHNEDELAAILAHEIAHVCCRHGLRAVEDETRKELIASKLETAANSLDADVTRKLVGGVAKATRQCWEDQLNGYSRDYEFQADERALHYLARAGYNPTVMPQLLMRMASDTTGAGRGAHSVVHPPTQERLERVHRVLEARRMSGTISVARVQRFQESIVR